MSPRRQAIAVALTAVAVGIFLVTVPTFREFFDLGVYRGAVRWWLLDGGDLYEFHYQGTEYGFTYPPFAALVFAPLAAMPWPVAVAVGLLVNTAAVVVLLRLYLVPVLRRHDWPMWTPCAFAFLAVLVFEPARDTFSFGQVNLALLVLVGADLRRGGRWAGIGVGLATAIKLTPAIFIGYLVVTRQYRAAAVASGTAAGATLLAAVLAPEPSRVFWTEALWDTGRVGKLEYVSNQSLRGVIARLDGETGGTVWWLLAVAVVVAAWFVLVRRLDAAAGVALTGLTGCLISPVTWVHHLVWLLPALFLLLDRGRYVLVAVLWVVLSSSVVWLWWAGTDGWLAVGGSNTYVWISLGLGVLLAGRARQDQPAGVLR